MSDIQTPNGLETAGVMGDTDLMEVYQPASGGVRRNKKVVLSILRSFFQKFTAFTSGNLLSFNSSGTAVDSGFSLDQNLKTNSSVQFDSVQSSSINTPTINSGGGVTIEGILLKDGEISGGNIYPVGATYIQFPGKNSPVALGLQGTWTNISSEFPGDFFRAEGGNSLAFEAGQQSDVIKNHNHTMLSAYSTGGSTGVRVDLLPTGNSDTQYPTSTNGGGDPAETRPANRTIRIWERTV